MFDNERFKALASFQIEFGVSKLPIASEMKNLGYIGNAKKIQLA